MNQRDYEKRIAEVLAAIERARPGCEAALLEMDARPLAIEITGPDGERLPSASGAAGCEGEWIEGRRSDEVATCEASAGGCSFG